MNSNGLDEYIVDKCYSQAQSPKKTAHSYHDVHDRKRSVFAAICQQIYGSQSRESLYTGLKGLGEMIFEDYETNRKKRIK
jgi:hypothetical protein